MNGARITVLRILDEEDHQKSDDGCARIDNELPRIGVVEVRAGYEPHDNDEESGEECPFASDPVRRLHGEDMKALLAAVPVSRHEPTIEKAADLAQAREYGGVITF